MIRITNDEHIKRAGEFKVDGLHVKRFHFDLQPETGAFEELTIELIPFATMDDSSKLFDQNNTFKVSINNLQQFLADNPEVAMPVGIAYYATEAAITALLGKKHPELQATYEAPQI